MTCSLLFFETWTELGYFLQFVAISVIISASQTLKWELSDTLPTLDAWQNKDKQVRKTHASCSRFLSDVTDCCVKLFPIPFKNIKECINQCDECLCIDYLILSSSLHTLNTCIQSLQIKMDRILHDSRVDFTRGKIKHPFSVHYLHHYVYGYVILASPEKATALRQLKEHCPREKQYFLWLTIVFFCFLLTSVSTITLSFIFVVIMGYLPREFLGSRNLRNLITLSFSLLHYYHCCYNIAQFGSIWHTGL